MLGSPFFRNSNFFMWLTIGPIKLLKEYIGFTYVSVYLAYVSFYWFVFYLLIPGVFNLLSSRANLHISCNPAGRSHCRLQNHEHVKHHHRGMCGSPGDVREVPMTYMKQPFFRFFYVTSSSLNSPGSFSKLSITAHSPTLPPLYLRHSSFYSHSIASPTSQLILQPFHCFTYVTAHSPTLPPLYLHHSSFSDPSAALPTSQLILQPFRCFTFIAAHSPTLPPLYLRHSPFSNPSVAFPTLQLILQPFRCFTYITAHSPTLPPLFLCHSSFSNPSATLPKSQLILQPFRYFTYITAHSPSLPLLYLHHSSFSNPSFAFPTSQALHLIHLASRPWFFHAPSNQCNLLFIFCFSQEKQLSLTETIKYEINKYMFKFIILKFFCCSEITNLTESKVDAGLLLSRLQFWSQTTLLEPSELNLTNDILSTADRTLWCRITHHYWNKWHINNK